MFIENNRALLYSTVLRGPLMFGEKTAILTAIHGSEYPCRILLEQYHINDFYLIALK